MTTGQGPVPAGLKTLPASFVPSRMVAYSSTAPGGRPGHLAGAAAAGLATALGLSAATAPVARESARAEASANCGILLILDVPPAGLRAREILVARKAAPEPAARHLITAPGTAAARRSSLSAVAWALYEASMT